MIKTPKNLSKQIGRCRSCKELIWWVYREGKALAFSVGIETDGTLYHWSKLHRETCPYAVDLEPAGPQNRRARADADSFAKNRWRTSCASNKELRPVDWNTVPIYDVPEKHAWKVAWKLVPSAAVLFKPGTQRTSYPTSVELLSRNRRLSPFW